MCSKNPTSAFEIHDRPRDKTMDVYTLYPQMISLCGNRPLKNFQKGDEYFKQESIFYLNVDIHCDDVLIFLQVNF